jgi:hypothetical protein
MSHHQTATINKLGQDTGHFEPEDGGRLVFYNKHAMTLTDL